MVRPIIKSVRSVLDDGTIEWRLNGKLHRIDEPAVIGPNGYQAWFFMGKFHREGGPALIYSNESEWWYQFGKLHREDGPAICGPNITCGYYLNGVSIPEQEYLTTDASKYPKLLAYQVMHG